MGASTKAKASTGSFLRGETDALTRKVVSSVSCKPLQLNLAIYLSIQQDLPRLFAEYIAYQCTRQTDTADGFEGITVLVH